LRAANGLPGNIQLDPTWSSRCAAHVRYMRATNRITHFEDPRLPAYTADGDWAARRSILASGPSWTDERFIWEDAPLHMAQLLAPRLEQTGIGDDGQFVCVTTLPGYTRSPPSTATVLTYPGNATRTRERAFTSELPITPAEALGFSNPTGPHLYVFQWGPATIDGVDARGSVVGIESASLTGPGGGQLRIRWVDRRHPTVGRFLPLASGIIVPARPLRPESAYVATVRFTNGVDHSWGFTTNGPTGITRLTNVRLTTRYRGARRVCVRRLAGVCVQRRVRHTHTLRVRGRIVTPTTGKGVPRLLLGVSFRRVERPLIRTRSDGSFDVSYQVESWRRRHAMNVTISSMDAISGTYRARFR